MCLCTCCPDRSLEGAAAAAAAASAGGQRLHPFTNTEAEALILNSGIFRCAVASLYSIRVRVRPSVRPSVLRSEVIFEGEKYAY